MRRRLARLGLGALLVGAIGASGAAGPVASAGALDVARVEDRILETRAHARITYENTVNVASYQQDGILTYNGYQYTAWYQNDGPGQGQATAVIARRELPSGEWESTRLAHPLWANDSHNTIALGVTPTDGRLHVTFPTHDNPVRYTRTVPGVLDHPELVEWSSRLFDQVYVLFPGATGAPQTFTYPQFENVGDETLVTWRDGSTSNGRQALLRYNEDAGGTWSFLGRFSHNAGGTYDGGFGTSTSRYGYIHGFTADPASGDLAVTFSWREQTAAWCEGPLAVGNHDLGYAVSHDGGLTWENNDGDAVATTTLGETSGTITPFTPGIVVEEIPINKGLINQETQGFDSAGRLHVVTSRVPDEDITGDCVGDFYVDRAANAVPYHHWRAPDGTWHTMELPFQSGSSGRTKIAFDSDDNAYVVLPDARIVAASAASEWSDWELVFDAAGVANVSELIVDRKRLREDDVLTVAYQEPPPNPSLCASSTSSPDCTSAFRLASFELGSEEPDAPRATEPEAAPAPAAGWSTDAAADLELGIEAAGPFIRGSTGTYAIEVTNVGGVSATEPITVRTALPEGLVVGGVGGGGPVNCIFPSNRVVECTTQVDLAPRGSAFPLEILAAVAADAPDSVTTTATLRAADDYRPANNVAATATAVADEAPVPAPPGAGGGGPDPTPPPSVAVDRPRLSQLKLANLLRGGLRIGGECAGVGSGTAALRVSAKVAKKLGRGKKATLARAAVTCDAGGFSAVLKAKGGAKRALKRLQRSLPATLAVEMSGPAGVAIDTDRVTLKAPRR